MRQALAGCCGPNNSTLTSTAGWRNAAATRSSRDASPPPQRNTGITCTTRMSSPCPTNGSTLVCGLGSRVPRAPAHAGGSGLQQSAARPDAAGHLPASQRGCPPTSGTSATSTLPIPVGNLVHLSTGEGSHRPGDIAWLERSSKAAAGISRWLNRKGPTGNNTFEGVLGLDNIGVFDRSAPAHRRISGQADGNGVDGALQSEHAGDGRGVGVPNPPTPTWL